MFEKEKNSVEIKKSDQWFFAKLAYLTKVSLDEGCGVIQEDLVLIVAPNAEVAYEEAMALGRRAETFGEGVLEGRVNWRNLPGAEAIADGMPRDLLHPGLLDRYKGFQFLGLKELGPLPGAPAHGLEIEALEISLDDEDRASIRSCLEETFSAFSPSGVAIAEGERGAWNSKLYEQYKWYLAEQVFEIEVDRVAESAETKALERLVLIKAEEPREAVAKARIEPPQDLARQIQLVGIREVSLVQSELVDGCELRSFFLELPLSRVLTYTREKSRLAAFATKSHGTAGL